MLYANYVSFLRKRAALSQGELGQLLGGYDRTVISRYESGEHSPSVDFLMACQVLFGTAPRELFNALYRSIEERVINNAVVMEGAIRKDKSEAGASKRALLGRMIEGSSVGMS